MTSDRKRRQKEDSRHAERPRAARPRAQRLSDALLLEAAPSFDAWHAQEPKLLFADRRTCEDPKTGLAQFGPAALDSAARNSIRVGIIGTGSTIQSVRNWIERATMRVDAGLNARGRPYDPMVAPSFPGFSEDRPFRCSIEVDDRLVATLTDRELDPLLIATDLPARVKAVVELVATRLNVLADKDPPPDVVICAMPKTVEAACGPLARAGLGRQKPLTRLQRAAFRKEEEIRKSGQRLLEFAAPSEPAESKRPRAYIDFHNTLKAHAMRSKLATQLVWDSTLARASGNEDPATTAWNFFTALYYKSGNIPWELAAPTPRTCFVGITFYRESADVDAATRTCLAQAFSETGEGLVLRGERVIWDKDRDRKPHMGRDDSEALLGRVLKLYREHFGATPSRVVVHKTSRYWPAELEGLKAALGDTYSYDFLALERRDIRFMRLGKEPPIRGTVIQLGPRNYLVYTRGYVPFLRQYPGARIPNPLEVVEHHGDSSAEKVCSEILSLTKLNWNTCAFASADPITIAFSRQVSTIIKELPDGVEPLTKYKFYM